MAGRAAAGRLRAPGSAAAGRFPGHGGVTIDSHLALPVDERDLTTLTTHDLRPFARLIDNGLEGVMPAHVIFSACDREPAGFSRYWLQDILRGRLRFQGVIFSDDLSMAAAECAGGYAGRARAALKAGCDTVLVCNNPEAADQVLAALSGYDEPASHVRMLRMHGRAEVARARLHQDPAWQEAIHILAAFDEAPSLSLDL